MPRILSPWVPKLSSDSQKLECVCVCRQFIPIWKKQSFLVVYSLDTTHGCIFLSQNKSSNYSLEAEGKSTPIKPRAVASAGKIIAAVFWCLRRIIIIDCSLDKVTINIENFVEVLRDLCEVKRSEFAG